MFTNKHVVVAMLVAPVLAMLAWFAVDYFLSERPHAATPGATYKLIPRSNCRYASGQCDLENGDFELLLQATDVAATSLTLNMRSRFPLQQATIGFINGGDEADPASMTPTGTGAMRWSASLDLPSGDTSMLGVAVSSKGVNYFAEVPTAFIQLDR
jgi:hypothetical protein